MKTPPEHPPCTKELFSLAGHVAWITGASGLLAEQYALALSEFGADLILTDIQLEGSQSLAARVTAAHGVRTRAYLHDVTSRASWETTLAKALDELGRVDVLINNAALTNRSQTANFTAPFQSFPLEDWNAILNVNLTGTFLGCQVVGEHMLRCGSGNIINVGSLYGLVSPHHRMYAGTEIVQPPAYSISKAGVIALTRYLATLWADRGVRVNCVTPGGIWNQPSDEFAERFGRLNPIGRMGWKEELRGAIVYLASDASSHCVGHNLIVDGGWTVW